MRLQSFPVASLLYASCQAFPTEPQKRNLGFSVVRPVVEDAAAVAAAEARIERVIQEANPIAEAGVGAAEELLYEEPYAGRAGITDAETGEFVDQLNDLYVGEAEAGVADELLYEEPYAGRAGRTDAETGEVVDQLNDLNHMLGVPVKQSLRLSTNSTIWYVGEAEAAAADELLYDEPYAGRAGRTDAEANEVVDQLNDLYVGEAEVAAAEEHIYTEPYAGRIAETEPEIDGLVNEEANGWRTVEEEIGADEHIYETINEPIYEEIANDHIAGTEHNNISPPPLPPRPEGWIPGHGPRLGQGRPIQKNVPAIENMYSRDVPRKRQVDEDEKLPDEVYDEVYALTAGPEPSS
ncbi:hypothetical protein NOR_06671 [Metarhizium rileyi]|uniref:Uncharacterized protein n=1 Tax=Metarhizium rileyi (strain RCEF 4871) TaxID=1649241 RepID=A0A167A819_METRR|nr:hypothetical protein NOR_06671 [Metarhizium rileyi RCEF 4871]